MNTFILGVISGALLVFIWAWRNAERIVKTKQDMKENDRRRGTPLIGLYKNRSKRFTPPQEAALIPESETVFQYPRKADLKRKPWDNQKENLWDYLFDEYVTKRRLENADAWAMLKQERLDRIFGKPIRQFGSLTDKDKEAFYEAMNRRRRKLAK